MKKLICIIFAIIISLNLFTAYAAVSIPPEVGKINLSYSKPIPSAYKNDPKALAAVTTAIQKEYVRLIGMKNKDGKNFYPGTPNKELVHPWEDTNMSQEFDNGDSTASRAAWSHNNFTVIMVGAPYGAAYTITNDVLQVWADQGGPVGVGSPLGNEFWDGNNLYQNFTHGYIVCLDGNWFDGSVVKDKKYVGVNPTSTRPGSTTTSSKAPVSSTANNNNNNNTNQNVSSTTATNNSSAASNAASGSQDSSLAQSNATNSTVSTADATSSSNNSPTYEEVTSIDWGITGIIIGISVVVLGAAGAGIWFFLKKKK